MKTNTIINLTEALLREAASQNSNAPLTGESFFILDLRSATVRMLFSEVDVNGICVSKSISFSILTQGNQAQVYQTSLAALRKNGSWQLAYSDDISHINSNDVIPNILSTPEHITEFAEQFVKLLRPLIMAKNNVGLVFVVETDVHYSFIQSFIQRILTNPRMQIPLFQDHKLIVLPPEHDIRGYAFFTCMADCMDQAGRYIILQSHRSGVIAHFDGVGFTYEEVSAIEDLNTKVRNYIVYSGTPSIHFDSRIRLLTDETSRHDAMLVGYIRWYIHGRKLPLENMESLFIAKDIATDTISRLSVLKKRLANILTKLHLPSDT